MTNIKDKLKKFDRHLYSPVPVKLKRLGDALLSVSTMITGFAIYEDVKWVAYSALITGVVGRFLIEYFGGYEPKG